ncbi:hypothetical protein IQ250_12485 [Pseudanabaenaceae cyanobacterium LEGE 13415]|nr:hypothetical protein [Pseudanabaenaceae cyanobacterium LEGE 13415]
MSDTSLTEPQERKSFSSKPISYYLSDPEDADTIAEIAVTYGDRLQALDRTQKLSLLSEMSSALLERSELQDEEISSAPNWLLDQVETLSNDTLLGLMAAVTEQLRHDK